MPGCRFIFEDILLLKNFDELKNKKNAVHARKQQRDVLTPNTKK
jgi:hypothetical protein